MSFSHPVHMNGRIYDPKLGRILQADPFIQSPTASQSLNRYSYVLNNPLSYTDPTGYFSFSRFVKKWWRVAVAAVVSYVTYGAASGWASAWAAGAGYSAGTAAVIGGVAGGAAAGFVSGGILTGTLKGAFYGGLTGAALGGIAATDWGSFAKSLASSAASGVTTELQGGKFGHGFLSAGMGFWTGLKFGGPPEFGKFLASALAGGTISEITGGKFANGAVSAGLAYVIAAGASSDSRDLTNTKASEMTDSEFASVFGNSSEWIAYESVGTMQQEVMQRDYQAGRISLEELNSFYSSQAQGAYYGISIDLLAVGGWGIQSGKFAKWLNGGPHLRIGTSRFGGRKTFRVAGDYLGKIPESVRTRVGIRFDGKTYKWDWFDLGPL